MVTRKELINEMYHILRELTEIENIEAGKCPSGFTQIEHDNVKCACWTG